MRESSPGGSYEKPVVFDDSVEVRSLRREELDGLCSRWQTGRVHEDHFARQLLGLATYLISWRADEPLGSGVVQWSGCIGSNAKKAYPQAVELNHLQVRAEFRGHGVGSELINAAEELARRTGRLQMGVSVTENNHDAERLYRRLGYRPSGVFDESDTTGSATMDRSIMRSNRTNCWSK